MENQPQTVEKHFFSTRQAAQGAHLLEGEKGRKIAIRSQNGMKPTGREAKPVRKTTRAI